MLGRVDLLLPLAVFVTATLGLAFLVEPFVTWYFQWAWWSYIFFADALNRRLGASSLVRGRTEEFLRLSGLSVVLWTFFEALNLRLGNWYYVMDHPWRWARWLGGVVAFATVLPGIVETESLLSRVGSLRHLPVSPLRWSRGKEVVCLLTGCVCLLLPLAWPDLFFPLAWGSLIFLLEPWNRRHARRSVLRELEAGEAGPLVRTLLAGLVCGVLWECWNFWARTKWVYTVPGFEELKVFEMPLLGFLGFPPFAVECRSVISFAEAWRERAGAPPGTRGRALRLGTVAAAVIATGIVFAAADVRSVDSIYTAVERLEVLPASDRARLAAGGLESPEALLRALSVPGELHEWSARTGLPAEVLLAHRERVALVVHRGLGQDRARELGALGIRTCHDLAAWSPERLAAALRATGARGPHRFLERRARAWLGGLERRRTSYLDRRTRAGLP
jgi:Domain of unknown function (DUF4332)